MRAVKTSGIGPVPWAKHLRAQPLPGSYPKEILVQFAKGDQNAVNPGTTAIIREGGLADRATFYRNDLAIAANPGIAIPKNPHLFVGQPTSPIIIVREIALGAQEQLAVFFASAGAVIVHPTPVQLFEAPIVAGCRKRSTSSDELSFVEARMPDWRLPASRQ